MLKSHHFRKRFAGNVCQADAEMERREQRLQRYLSGKPRKPARRDLSESESPQKHKSVSKASSPCLTDIQSLSPLSRQSFAEQQELSEQSAGFDLKQTSNFGCMQHQSKLTNTFETTMLSRVTPLSRLCCQKSYESLLTPIHTQPSSMYQTTTNKNSLKSLHYMNQDQKSVSRLFQDISSCVNIKTETQMVKPQLSICDPIQTFTYNKKQSITTVVDKQIEQSVKTKKRKIKLRSRSKSGKRAEWKLTPGKTPTLLTIYKKAKKQIALRTVDAQPELNRVKKH